jgi:hypothetical protein
MNFSDEKTRKEVVKDILTGEEVEMPCFLLRQEGKLGRSSVIDLSAPYKFNFRQIDHRTVNSVVLHNTCYESK